MRSGQYNAGYVDSAECEGCHADVAATYHKTGMGRSFYRPTKANAIERYTGNNTFDHPASGMHYTMLERDGKFFQRRSTTGVGGREENVVEEQVDYVIGSGTHARTYLHRGPDGKLIELPVSWYTERSGYWAMSPGFDNKSQPDMHGPIGPECMFCHNAYPLMDDGAARELDQAAVFPASLPEGIDCQRCHGPGQEHIALAKGGKASEAQISGSIVNPAKLPRERQLEVCMQCHLETSSRHIPAALRTYGTDINSFRPGQQLGDYKLYFERVSNPESSSFEIAHAGYQLPKSACFRNSQMTCLTCHDPHDIPHGPEAMPGYVEKCESCHKTVVHTVALPSTENCISCHMPKRRTEGSVHVVLTDHYIQRNRPLGDLLKPIPEQLVADDHALVQIYYPKPAPQNKRAELYLAIAQVDDGDGVQGLQHLQTVLERDAPSRPEPYLEMARALVRRGREADAIPWFERALAKDSDNLGAMREMGVALLAIGQGDRAVALLRQAVTLYPKDDLLLTNLGNACLRNNLPAEAEDALHRALAINPERGDVYNLLGLSALSKGDKAGAEHNFREAMHWRPDLSEPYDNLGTLLTGSHQFEEAALQFGQALKRDPKDGEAHHGLGVLLLLQHEPARAEAELREAARLKPDAAQIHADLADLLAAKNSYGEAAAEYRVALAHNAGQADVHLGLAVALLHLGRPDEAAQQLQIAAAGPDPGVSQQAQSMLQQLVR
jgi:Tfp pilus assembly protein PilF